MRIISQFDIGFQQEGTLNMCIFRLQFFAYCKFQDTPSVLNEFAFSHDSKLSAFLILSGFLVFNSVLSVLERLI